MQSVSQTCPRRLLEAYEYSLALVYSLSIYRPLLSNSSTDCHLLLLSILFFFSPVAIHLDCDLFWYVRTYGWM